MGVYFTAISIFAIGLVFEVVGDVQKSIFKSNGGKGIMKTGVWMWTRHPNYYGEIVMWWSIYAISVDQNFKSSDLWFWNILNVISPTLTMLLLLFVSGMPLAEGKALKRIADRGALEEWK